MKRLLHVNASPRGARSRSGIVGAQFLAALQGAHPGLEVETLDLFELDLPDFDGGAIEGRYNLLMGEAVDPEQAQAWAEIRNWGEHFLGFDGWLFTVPMWNFGVPYKLKHYVDILTHPGVTFTNDATGKVTGLAAGRTAIVMAASAMPIEAGGPLSALDFQLSYLQTWLGFIGVTDIRSLRIAPTFGDPQAVERIMAQAGLEAQRMAQQI